MSRYFNYTYPRCKVTILRLLSHDARVNSTHGRIRQISSIFGTKSDFFGTKFGARKNRHKKTATTFFVTVRCENRVFILVKQVKRAPAKTFYRLYSRQFRAIFIYAENFIFLTLPHERFLKARFIRADELFQSAFVIRYEAQSADSGFLSIEPSIHYRHEHVSVGVFFTLFKELVNLGKVAAGDKRRNGYFIAGKRVYG